MAIMAMDTQTKKSYLPLIILLFSPALSYAGNLEFKPSVTLEEVYSDNIELNSLDEKSGVVSQPGIKIDSSYQAQNTTINLTSSSVYALYSHDDDLNTDYHELSADSKILLWPNGITFNASAAIENVPQNTANNLQASIVSGDLVQTERYRAGLSYLASNSTHEFYAATNYTANHADDGRGESEGTDFSIMSENGNGVDTYVWDINGNYVERKNNGRDSRQHIADIKLGLITQLDLNPFIRYYDESNEGNVSSRVGLNTNSYGAGFRWRPKDKLAIDLSYNIPSDDSLDSNGDEQKEYLDVSINWQLSSKTNLEASHSQRFYGDSYGFNLSHQNKRLTNKIVYDEIVESFTRDNYQTTSTSFLCQNPNATSLEDCYIQDGDVFSPGDSTIITIDNLQLVDDNDYSLNKSLSWSSILQLPRTNFSLNLGKSQRENLNRPEENNTQSAGFTAKRQLGPRTSLTLSTKYTEREFVKAGEDNQIDIYRNYKLSFNKQLNNSLLVDFSLEHFNRSSNRATYNYEENRVSAKITKDF